MAGAFSIQCLFLSPWGGCLELWLLLPLNFYLFVLDIYFCFVLISISFLASCTLPSLTSGEIAASGYFFFFFFFFFVYSFQRFISFVMFFFSFLSLHSSCLFHFFCIGRQAYGVSMGINTIGLDRRLEMDD
ncbi:hypothetical protein DFH27DRAFT_136321 [Peziza echinospora]|nr:hypothetical protein DFH27DRAFT_136321 [Peziza echinospora]